MTTIPVSQNWASGWSQTLSGNGALSVDSDNVLTISASAGSAIKTFPFAARGGDRVKASLNGAADTGGIILFFSYDAAGQNLLNHVSFSPSDGLTGELLETVVPNNYGQITLYFGVGVRPGSSGSGKAFSPRVTTDTVLN